MVHIALFAVAFGQLGWKSGTPEPILEADPEFVAMYWHAWETHRAGIHEEAPGGLPSPLFAPSGRLSASEAVTGTLFTRWAWRASGAYETLDSYLLLVDRAGQAPAFWILEDGTRTGPQQRPLFGGWAAWSLYRITGDKSMVERVFSPLARIHAVQAARYTNEEGLRSVTPETSLVPESGPAELSDSSEVAAILLLESHYLALCAQAIGLGSAANVYQRAAADEAKRLAAMWLDKEGAFRAKNDDGEPGESATLIPMLSIAAKRSPMPTSKRILESLADSTSFRTPLLYPSLPRTDSAFRGDSGVRPLLQYLIVRALIEAGERGAAAIACESMLRGIARSWRREQQLYTEYGPLTMMPSPQARPSGFDAGYVAVAGLIEAVLGFDVDAPNKTIDWFMTRRDRHGISRLRMGSNTITLIARERKSSTENPVIEVKAESPFTLRVTSTGRTFTRRFSAGESTWEIR